MIQIHELYKKLGKRMILRDISLELQPGVYGLLGANGAGKTTLIRCLTGLYKPTMGQISFKNEDIDRHPQYKKMLGYLPQAFGMFPELTLREMMSYFCAQKDIPKNRESDEINRVLEAVNLMEQKNARLRTLSGGMVRRAGVAQALLGDSPVIIFDEPTAGLDPQERARFKRTVAENRGEKVVLISTHIVEDIASGCEYVLVIHQGRIVFKGTCDELRLCAKDKVYEGYNEDASSLPEEAEVVRTTPTSNGNLHHIICNNHLPLQSVEPTLEDGYLHMIKYHGASI